MKEGYGYDVFTENVSILMKQGVQRLNAVAAAYAAARRSYFKRFPKGALPLWLSYPKRFRLRQHYTKQGEPIGAVTQYQDNPRASGVRRMINKAARIGGDKRNYVVKPVKAIQRAQKLFAAFTGRHSNDVQQIDIPDAPAAGLVFGQLIKIGYRSARDGGLYMHTFRSIKSRPLLIASSDGKTVYIVGGRYAFTERGIEDR